VQHGPGTLSLDLLWKKLFVWLSNMGISQSFMAFKADHVTFFSGKLELLK
jgi:hypothetical protein